MSNCPICPHCQGDYTGPAAVGHGKAVPLSRPSATLLKLQVLAPAGALDRILRWLEDQAGTRGRRAMRPEIITDDGEWTELRLPREPEIIRKGGRKTA